MNNLCQILWDRAKSDPYNIYIYNSVTEGVSYSKAVDRATKLANYLRCNGQFSKKPILAVIFDNAEFLIYLIRASLAAGICLAFLPKNRHLGQTRLLMNQVSAKALVTDVPELKALSLHLSFDALEIAHSVEREFDMVAPHAPAFIFQTSGTTGEAKWVAVSKSQFLAAIQSLWRAGGLNHGIDQVVYLTPPLSHSYGLSSLLEYTFVGSTIALPRGTSPLGAVGDLREPSFAANITTIEAVPYFYAELSKLVPRGG